MGERRRRRCPLCGGTGVFCGKCYRCSGRGYVLAECHTVLTMGGETTTTGEDDIGRCPATFSFDDGYGPEIIQCSGRDGHGWQHRFAGETWLSDTEPNCPAPTPRAP
jgi:hypothetical protein